MPATRHRVACATVLALALGTQVTSAARSQDLWVRGVLHAGSGAAAGVLVRLSAYPDSYQRRLVDLREATLPAAAASTATAADGRFEVPLPGLGPWWLLVGTDEGVVWRQDLMPSNDDSWLERFEIPVASKLAIRVVGEDGAPLEGALVVVDVEPVRGHSWGRYRPLRQSARTDEQGRASLWSVIGSSTIVYATSPGRRPELVVLQPGVALEPELRLVTGKPAEVRARLPSGAPAARAVVRVGDSMVPVGLTDGDGRIVVARPQEDEMRYQIETATLDYGSLVVTASGTEPSIVVLEAPIRLSGVVREAGTGRPVLGAVAWFWHRPSDHAVSGRDGSWGMRAWSAEEDLPLQVTAAGYSPASLRLGELLRVGGDVPAVHLHPVVELVGRVIDAASEPVAGAELRAQATVEIDYERHADARASSAADGSFRFRALPPDGELVVEVTHAEHAPRRAELGRVRGVVEGAPLEIVLSRGREAVGDVRNAAGDPVVGASVELLPAGDEGLAHARFVSAARGDAALATLSNAEGRFRVPRTPAGHFDLAVSAPGYAPTIVPRLEVPEGQGEHELGTVTLEPGLVLDGKVVDGDGRGLVDARVELRTVADQYSPTGTETRSGVDGSFQFRDLRRGEEVTFSVELEGWAQTQEAAVRLPSDSVRLVLSPVSRIRGRVVDSDGAGVEGVSLTPRPSPRSLVNLRGSWRASSDQNGSFELKLPAGSWTLWVHPPPGLSAPKREVTLEPGETLDDLVIELQEAAVVTGTVSDPDGAPVSGAAVSLETVQASGGGGSSGGGRSDAAGRYRIALDELGAVRRAQDSTATRYAIEVRHEGFRSARREVVPQPGETRLDFQLERGLEISGQVVGADGAPIGGATVRSYPVGDNPRAAMIRADQSPPRSDADGRFTLRGLDADTPYELLASASGYATPEPLRVELGGTNVDGVRIELEAGTTLRGVVRGLATEDLAHVSVRAHLQETLGGTRFDFDRYRARPDFEGRFEIVDLGPGRWQVVAETEGFASERRAQKVVDVVPGESPFVELEFGGGFTLSGLVLVDGVPAPGLRVFVTGIGQLGAPSQITTDVNGLFRAEGIAPGAVLISVYRNGSSRLKRVLVEGDTEVQIDLRLGRSAGRVVAAASGEPIAGARVTAAIAGATPEDIWFASSTETAADGSFALELDEGSYALAVSRAGFAGKTTAIDVTAGAETAGVVIELEPAAEVVLVAALSGGVPASSLFAMHVPSAGGVTSLDQIATEPLGGGRFALRSFGPGTWDLLVSSENTAFERIRVTAPGPPVTVTLSAAGLLQVTAPSFANLAAHIELYDPSGARFEYPMMTSLPLQGGQAFVSNVPVGPWRVRVVGVDGRVAEANVVVEAGAVAKIEIP